MLLKIKVFGDVQGVGLRYSVWMKARALGVAGFVRNEPDGTVYIEAEGERRKLEEFMRWCEKKAPEKIEKVDFDFTDNGSGNKEFTIL